ncbi:MAG: Na(+)/H(+) antiporter subunit B [Gammaproteobacteria bacterium]|nr:Na(+)/H(+) antiporter subunit B [Gammaproteobacteria bacterium]
MSVRKNPILLESSHLLIPAILLFALYVQFHGDYGPGGGFQAGVIFASGIILYALLHGIKRAEKVISLNTAKIFAALGLLLYAGVGVFGILLGGNYLDYNVLAHDPIHGQHWGILIIELGVGLTVAAVIISIFYAFAKFKR